MEKHIVDVNSVKVYIGEVEDNKQSPCPACGEGYALVTGKTNNSGITLCYAGDIGWNIMAYGYDIHSSGSNGLIAPINFCPICGRILRTFDGVKEVKKDYQKNKI